MYSRFFTKFLRDLTLLTVGEPFTRLLTQGMVLKDGAVMSKSRGNIVDPDQLIQRYGADAARVYILFAAPPEDQLEWNERAIEGISRFLNRVWTLAERVGTTPAVPAAGDLRRHIHAAIKRVTEDLEQFKFNTAISALMELINALAAQEPTTPGVRDGVETLVQLLYPFAPHVAEELWAQFGHRESLARHPWPTYDPAALKTAEVTLVLQVNGKVRARITVPSDLDEPAVRQRALADPIVQKWLSGTTPRQVVVVPNKLVNIVA